MEEVQVLDMPVATDRRRVWRRSNTAIPAEAVPFADTEQKRLRDLFIQSAKTMKIIVNIVLLFVEFISD